MNADNVDVNDSQNDYQAAVSAVRAEVDNAYRPAFAAYLQALEAGSDDATMAGLADALSDAADAVESTWTRVLHTRAMDLPNGAFVNEAAGAMAMLADLWEDLRTVHTRRARTT